ncbi:MAG: DUF11 domain-containing protein [Sulfuricurvum sp.]|uniref:DUF11 domain-containing protein n=1 Tax=Sulfuricurvum sp. TaxID=2025608 RepID=UPI002723C9A7|nr:DUF11 domain-containing protein [Sulfuricurvum sp.]MDO9055577.1 DUF11 domain-containing protein [Sulfuricurvum sp.]
MKINKLFLRSIMIFGLVMVFAVSNYADTENNDNCTQRELITEMDNEIGSYSHTENGQVSDGDEDYYYFTAQETGILSINYSSNRNTDLWTQVGGTCMNSSTQRVNDGQSYTGSISVNAGQLVFIRIRDNSSNSSPTYSLALSYGPPPSADLSIIKAVNNANPNIGDLLTFTLTGTNNGPSSSQVTITDTLPASLTLVSRSENSSNFSCNNVGNAVSCTGTRSFNSGEQVVVTITATVNAVGSATNTASIVSANSVSDNNLLNNSASVTFNTTLTAPVIVLGQTFEIPTFSDNGMIVGTVNTTGGVPTSFVILGGNDVGIFAINNTGEITIANNTNIGISGTSYTLSIQALNGAGSDTENVVITVSDTPIVTANYRDFTLRTQLYAKGNMKTIGNTVLVAPSPNSSANCSTYTNGAYLASSLLANTDVTLCGYSVDGTQQNATTSELALPANSKVIWAGLYWQGMMRNTIDTNMLIRIRQNNSTYVDIRPNVLNYADSGYNYDGDDGISYAAFTNISHLFGEGKWNEGNYTVANVPVIEGGKGTGLGTYGAWTLVAIYETPSEKFRSFSVFDGWKKVTSSTDAVIPVSGFYTPNRILESTAAKVSVFAAEGDYDYTGDQLITKNYNTNTNVALETISNNTFNSSITGGGVRTPNASNNFGIDIQSFNIGHLLTPKQTDMTLTMTSNLDIYWPSMIAFSTELIAPELCYDYSFKQDGHYLKADNNGSQLPLLTGFISESSIETAIYLRNNEADIKAEGISFYTDVNATMFSYVNGTTQTSNINGSQYIPRTETTGACNYDNPDTTPIGCSSGADIRIGLGNGATGYSQYGGGSLGDREFVYAKFDMDPIGVNGIDEVNQSLGLKLNYYIVPKTGAEPIPYDYEFGIDIPMCPPSAGYTPVWGTFNVVDHAAATVNGLPANNLRTQVSRKPFAVDVATYEKNTDGKYTKIPTIDMNTTVLVEMIDNDAFHDANASCANPGSVVSAPIYVRLDHTSIDMTVDIPVQNSSYHNFAVKNAAYRIWYFDQNQTLINWAASTSDATRKNLTSIGNLYISSYHTECSSECSSATSITCFDCIKANYARPLCSRDNFAVRPESYDLRIYDVNQTLAQTNPLKNTTKIDLSTQYQYTPQFGASIGRINIAAGYNYRFDMNATGNDINLSKVPGYTRYFNGANTEYNATMIWDPEVGHITTGCNDTNGKSLSFYVANGQMLNTEQNQSQVGEYRLNIIDSAWSAADWQNSLLGHHTTSNGFELTKEDCIVGVTSTVSLDGKIGCITSSQHSGGGYTYKDHDLRLKPSVFDLNGIVYGLGKTPLIIAEAGNGYVYNSDLGVATDMVMSVRSAGPVKAVGYGGETLSNFVKDCYAVDLNLSIRHDANLSNRFVGRMSVAESNGTQIYDSGEFNVTGRAVQTIEDTYFGKAGLGQVIPTIHLNYDRNTTTPIAPHIVQYYDLNVSCLSASDCNMSAMSNHSPNTAIGSDLMDFNVTHVYGRLVPRDVRATAGAAFSTLAYYEVYKSPTLLGTGLTADAFDSDWRVNALHTDSNYGDANVTVIFPVSGSSLPAHTDSINGVETYQFPAFTDKLNHKAHIDTEGWLWYGGINALLYADPDNLGNLNCLTHPCFDITLGRIIGNTGSAKKESEAHKANKKTTSTGWSTTNEYAPAVK